MAEPNPIACGAHGLCPHCGARTLFAGVAQVAERCRACGLDFTGLAGGDRIAALLILLLAAALAAIAIALDHAVRVPFWVHILLWVPVTAGAVVMGLRAMKGLLVALAYRRGARAAGVVGRP